MCGPSSGNAAAEARAGGADEETALLYGMLSGSIEVLTEQIGGGIPGLNSGALDNWLMGMAQSNTGRAALKHLVNALGEGAEEFISVIAGAYLAQMWNGDKPDFWQTLGDAFYAGLIGTLTFLHAAYYRLAFAELSSNRRGAAGNFRHHKAAEHTRGN